MSDAKPEPSKETAKPQRGKNKRSLTFQEMIERRNFSVPDEAFQLYKALSNPFAVFVQQFRAAGMPEVTIETLQKIVFQSERYYKRRLDCLKIIAEYAHSKPGRGPVAGHKPLQE